jgi:nitrate reductase alpha subunit
VPDKTMPKLIVVERDYPNVADKWAALGPLVEQVGTALKGASWVADQEVAELRASNGAVRGGVADGRPSLERVEQACEAILALSGRPTADWRQRALRRSSVGPVSSWRSCPARGRRTGSLSTTPRCSRGR